MKAGPQRAVQLSALAALGGLALLLAGAVDTQTTPAGPVPRLDLWNNAFRAVKATGPDGRKVFYTAEEIVARGSDVVGQGVRTAWPIGDTWTSTLRDKTAATHRAAAERGVPLRVFVKIRPDHYRELPDAVARPGFDDGWLMAIPRARFEGDRARYASAGWGVGFADIVSPAFVARVLPEGGSTAPCLYGYNEARDKQFVTVGALTDLRNPAYRRWQIAWVQELMRFTGADGVTIGVKSSWHASPMTKPVAAPGNAGGPLSQTPYGPGEFERAMGDYVVELAATGVPVTVVEGAVGPSGRFGWVTPAVRNALLGVVRFREPSRD